MRCAPCEKQGTRDMSRKDKGTVTELKTENDKSPGGAVMRLKSIVVGYLETNCYVLAEETGDAVIIDPGASADRILHLVDEMGVKPQCIMLTHTHSDHIGGLEGVRKAWDVPVLLSAEEAVFLRLPDNKKKTYQRGDLVNPVFNLLKDGDVIDIGNLELRTMLTPGHTPGSVCWSCGDVLFSGDTLFKDGIGRTDFEGGSYEMIMKSIKEKILALPDATKVLPGHGQATTIGTERSYF